MSLQWNDATNHGTRRAGLGYVVESQIPEPQSVSLLLIGAVAARPHQSALNLPLNRSAGYLTAFFFILASRDEARSMFMVPAKDKV